MHFKSPTNKIVNIINSYFKKKRNEKQTKTQPKQKEKQQKKVYFAKYNNYINNIITQCHKKTHTKEQSSVITALQNSQNKTKISRYNFVVFTFASQNVTFQVHKKKKKYCKTIYYY